MASFDPKTKSTYATTNWAQYHQGRPEYPRSLTEIIYNYRRRHLNAGWDRLVDIGSGSGIASTNFIPDFKAVHLSDPSPANEDQARAFLTEWANHHGVNIALEFSQSTGEETYTKAGEGNADLVISATAAHFMDPDGLATSIAKILRPGGTLAVFSYWLPTFPGRSQHFHDVFGKAYDDIVLRALLAAADEQGRKKLGKVIERRMAGKGALDSVPIPEDLFEDPLRVYINSNGEVPYNKFFQQFEPADISRVSSRDQIVNYRTGTDVEAEGWSFDADKKWIVSFFNTIRPTNSQLSEEEAAKAFAEWNKVFDEECPSGTVRVHWSAYLVLATRK
ncbi:hypothetical protein AAE478_005339 [Parahypoxylon ruwenzoriense]